MSSKYSLFFVSAILLFFCVNLSSAAYYNVSSCTNLTEAGSTYYLNRSLIDENLSASSASGACFSINASNIIFDCLGYELRNNTASVVAGENLSIFGIESVDVTVRGCNITVGYAYMGGYLLSANSSRLFNNTFNGGGSTGFGVVVNHTFSSLLENNTFRDLNTSVVFGFGSSNNVLRNSVFYNPLTAFLTSDSYNNTVRDCNLSNSSYRAVKMLSSSSSLFLVNVSYSSGLEELSGASNLTRKWYYSAFVNDSLGFPVSGANVTAHNVSGSNHFTLITNSTGWTSQTEIIDYVANSSFRSYYGNYSFFALNYSYPPYQQSYSNHSYNISSLTNVYYDVFTLTYQDSVAPAVYPQSPASGDSSTSDTLNFTFTLFEHGRIANCSLIVDGSIASYNTSAINNSALNSITYGPLSIDQHSYSINCTDVMNNRGNSTTRYFNITDDSGDSGGGGGGGGSNNPALYMIAESQFNNGYNQNLGVNDRIRVRINSSYHYIKLVSLSSSSIMINVSSDTQQATLNIGDTRFFDLDGDFYYDLSVRLFSIDSTKSKANLTVKSDNSSVLDNPSFISSNPQNISSNSSVQNNNRSSGNQSLENLSSDDKGASLWWLWILIIVLIIMLVVGIWFFIQKSKGPATEA